MFICSEQAAYLGHIIFHGGVAMDREKIQAVSFWPLPGNIKALRGFSGLIEYCRKFIQSYGTIADLLCHC